MRTICLLLVTGVALGAEPVLIFRGDSIGDENAALRDEVAGYANRVAAALEAVGVAREIVSDRELSAARCGDAPLIVLPYNRLTDAHVQSLRAYVEAGGKVAAYFTTGSPRLLDLLGVMRGELAGGGLRSMVFTAAARQARPYLPEALDQASEHAFELSPLAGSAAIATWGPGGRAAIIESPAGVYVGHVMLGGDLYDKGLFLLALAAERNPGLWHPALLAERNRATALASEITTAWESIALHPSLEPERGAELQRAVAELTAQAALLPPPPTAGAAAPALLAVYRRVREAAEALLPKLATSPEQELRGIWVYGSQPVDWPAFAVKCRDAGLNAVFYRVGRGGSAIYPSDVLPQEEWSKGRDEMAEAIRECHRYGLEFHAWRVTFHLGSAPDWYKEQLRAEGRLSTRYGGETTMFANPGDPRNREVERRAIRELVEKYEVDGVHLDYIRYTEVPDYDVDYGPISRREFEQRLGRPVGDWPFDVERGELKWQYEDFQRENINTVVRTASQDIRAIAPQVCLSAAVWRANWKYKYAIKQDWSLWCREGWIDLVVPMNYVDNAGDQEYDIVRQLASAAGSARMAAGLGCWLIDGPEAVRQVEVARRAGADGFVLFSSNAEQIDEQLAALRAGATARPARPSTQAPRADWRLPRSVPRRYEPAALQEGVATPLQVTLGPGCGTIPGAMDQLAGTVSMRRPATGEELGEVGSFVADGEGRAVFTGELTPPAGTFQLIVRGSAVPRNGDPKPFVLLGPVVEGLSGEQAQDLAARLVPPVPVGEGTPVGVWFDTIAGDAVLARLHEAAGVAVATLWQLTPEALAPLKVLIIPQLRDVGDWRPEPLAALRDWVAGGGTLYLCHDAVGYRWHPTPFPELGYGVGMASRRIVVSREAIGATPAGTTFEHLYGDHVLLKPTARATVVLAEPDGTPVVLRGPFGRGTVVLDGRLTGATGGTGVMPAEEFQQMLALCGIAGAE